MGFGQDTGKKVDKAVAEGEKKVKQVKKELKKNEELRRNLAYGGAGVAAAVAIGLGAYAAWKKWGKGKDLKGAAQKTAADVQKKVTGKTA